MRATMNTILEQSGVPDSLRAAWLGHTVAVNRTGYLGAPADLATIGDMIGRVLGTA